MLKLAARIGVISVIGSPTVAFAQSWAAPVNGFWSESAKWSPQAVPGAGAAVLLPFTSAYTVTQNGSVGIDSLDIANPLAQLLIANGALLTLNGLSPLAGDGAILINNGGSSSTGVQFANTSLLSGTGTVLLNAVSGSHRAYVQAMPGATVTHGSGRTIRGKGGIYGNWINEGLIQADSNDVLQFMSSGAHIGNNGVIQSINGGSVLFNSQTITQGSPGRLITHSASSIILQGTSIVGGTIEALNGGVIQLQSSTAGNWSDVTPIGPMVIQNGSILTINTAGLTHAGTININPTGGGSDTGLNFKSSGNLDGGGTVILNAVSGLHRAYLQAMPGATATHAADRSLVGNGSIYGTWINRGTISPGFTTGSVGEIGLRGPMTLGATSALVFDVLGGAGGQFDSLPGNSPLTLNGSISVKINGWNPTTLCSSINLITASSISGKFSSYVLDTPTPPAGMVWRLNYQPTRVALGLTCRPDLTGDCQVDDADFTIFAESYNILDCADPTMPQDCPADINQDGAVDDADFSLFAVAYDDLICS